jgi:leader peptidase (prepilin peptidase)/N-methyltransferase
MFHLDLPLWFSIILSGMLGAAAGSFFNVVIHRVPRGESVFHPGSHCPRCGHKIPFHQNIPIFSWIILKGRCKYCREPISAMYPTVELVTAALSILLYWVLLHKNICSSTDIALGLYFFILATIPIFLIDIRHHLIPDVLNYTGMVLGLGLSFIPGGNSPLQSFSGLLGAGVILWIIRIAAQKLLKKEALGLGDVKLLAMAGSLFGLFNVLLGLFIGSLLGSVSGFLLMAVKKLNQQKQIPFGPFLCLGIIIAVIWGEQMLDWYLGFFGLH